MSSAGNAPEVPPADAAGRAPHPNYAFGDFVLDEGRAALRHLEEDVPLRPKAYEILAYFVRHPGRVVTRDELMDAVWGDLVVTDASITQCLLEIRRALGDEAHAIIRTIPRRGYLFDLPVRAHEPASPTVATAPTPPEETPERGRHRLVVTMSIIVVALVTILVALTRWPSRDAGESEAPFSPPFNSIAVLPFDDMSVGREHDIFGNGFAEELTTILAKNESLIVTARTSAFSFRGQAFDVPTIGRALDVAWLLEGSVRITDDRLRISVQLVDTRTNAHHWSESFQRARGDWLRVQVEIARAVAQELGVVLVGNAPRPSDADPTDLMPYHEGRAFLRRRDPGDLKLASDRFLAAIERAPDYAPAWSGLASTYFLRFEQFGLGPDESLPRDEGMARMRQAVARALALDPMLPEAHVRAANYCLRTGQYADARMHFDRALEVGPNDPLALSMAATGAVYDGDFRRSLELMLEGTRRDPVPFISRGPLIGRLISERLLDDAHRHIDYVSRLYPEQTARLLGPDLVKLALIEGRLAEAREGVEAIEPGYRRDAVEAMVAHAHGDDGAANAALDRLSGLQASLAGRNEESYVTVALADALAFMGRYDQALETLVTTQERRMALAPPYGTVMPVLIFSAPFLIEIRNDPRWLGVAAETRARWHRLVRESPRGCLTPGSNAADGAKQ